MEILLVIILFIFFVIPFVVWVALQMQIDELKKQPRTQTTVNEAPRFVMTTFRNVIIIADNKQGKIKELSLDDNEMYQIKTIVEFSK
jgi:hypothetical protein